MSPDSWLMKAAEVVLDRRDLDRTVLPTIADAREESRLAQLRGDERGAERIRRALLWQLLQVVAWVWVQRWTEAVRATRWWTVGLGLIAALAAALGMNGATSGSSLAARHVAFSVIAVASGSGIPLLAFGGSILVATFVLLGLLARAARRIAASTPLDPHARSV